MISNYDILIISKYIHLYQISLVLSNLAVLKYPFCPCPISRENIHDDIQLWYPGYIQVYPCLINIDICIRYSWCYPIKLSCYICLYPWCLSFCSYMMWGFVWAFSAVRGFFFCSNALPISLNILSYPFTEQGKQKLNTFGLEPSILCILTSGLNHYATILDIKPCFLLVHVTDAGPAADTLQRRCHCGDGPGAGVAAGPPMPPITDALIPPPTS